MSQHDMDVANAAGATVRSDINAALQALASTSKGSAAPATPYTGQIWIDDSASPWVLKCYDGANHIPIGTIDPTNNVFAPVLHGSPYYAALAGTDTYTGTLSPAPAAYIDGALYLGKVPNANTSTTPTVNYNSLGAKTIVKNGNAALAADDMPANHMTVFQYNSALGKMVLLNPKVNNTAILRGHIAGLTMSNNGIDPTNDVDIAAGEAVNSTNAYLMQLASSMTKRLDASWVVGTNQGMLDGTESVAGTPDVSTWYHIYLICKDSDGSIDVLASESASAPTMPAGYTYKRRIGSVYNDSAGNIKAFTQVGDDFLWSSPPLDVDVTGAGSSAVTRTLTAPVGVKTKAMINVAVKAPTTGIEGCYISSLDTSDFAVVVPNGTNATPLWTVAGQMATNTVSYGGPMEVWTNTSSQIRSRMATGGASDRLSIATLGWMDPRGRND